MQNIFMSPRMCLNRAGEIFGFQLFTIEILLDFLGAQNHNYMNKSEFVAILVLFLKGLFKYV